MSSQRLLLAAFIFVHLLLPARALEKDDWDFPLGPIGGRCYLQLGENSVRISEVFPGEPGSQAGLQVNDYITGLRLKKRSMTPGTSSPARSKGSVKRSKKPSAAMEHSSSRFCVQK